MSLGKHPDSLLNFSGREMNAKEGHSYCFRSFRLDVEERRLFDNGVPVSLEPKVFDVLAALVLRNGHLVEKEELLHLVWSDSFVEEANIARIVYTLRKVLGEDENGNKFIETVAKKGYRFVAEVDEIREPAAANSANDNPDSRETAETPSAVESHTPTFESDATRSPSVAMPKRNVRIILFGVGFLSAIFLTVLLSFNFQPDPSVSPNEVKSIAVLPFVNATGDTNTEYVSDGISDSIINSLSRLPDMKVIALTSVLRYKGKQIDPQTVGRELNVNAVLMGRLTQQGENLAISAELVDVRDNRRLWGGQYSSNLSDLLVVQGEIARQISDGLRLRLSAEEKKQLVKQYTENAEAYQLYILGRHYSNKLTKEGFEKSIEYYEQAIKKDPSYALPYTGIAFSYYFMGNRGFWTAKESGQKLEWAALKALELDDALADGHVFLGVSKYSNFDWTGAEKEIIKALELEPNSYLANFTFFTYLSNVGRFDEALFYGKRAAELDQTTQPGLLAYAYFVARQYDKAIELYREVLQERPNNAQPHVLLGETYAAKGLYGEGVEEIQKGVALDNAPERWDRQPMLAYAYAMAGRHDEALKILDEQKRLAKQGYISPYNFAIIYTGLDDKDRAFEWLEKGFEQRTQLIYRIKSRPMFDPLRSDPRYAKLLRKMNLEP